MTDPSSSPPYILIVEDEAFIALDLKDLLEDGGFKVLGCVGTSSEAFDLLDRTSPDLAILDFNLRQETSAAIAARLDELGTPYLFLSGRSRNTIGTDRPVIRKPFDPDGLMNSVRALRPRPQSE